MSYARWRAASDKLEQLDQERRRLLAERNAELPFFGDDIFVLIAAELDAHMLGRLGCAAQRFWRPSVPDPAHQRSPQCESPCPAGRYCIAATVEPLLCEASYYCGPYLPNGSNPGLCRCGCAADREEPKKQTKKDIFWAVVATKTWHDLSV